MSAAARENRLVTCEDDRLPPGWRMVRFGDVVRNVRDKIDPFESDLERYVAGEHMDTDDLHIRRWGTIGDGYLGPAFHRHFRAGQVLYGSRRTYLRKVALAEWDGVCANTTFVLEPKTDELLPDLLPFIMQTKAFVEHSIKQSRGSVNPYVNFSDLAWYGFPLPQKDEQRRIAEILWAADESQVESICVLQSALQYRDRLFSSLIETGLNPQCSREEPWPVVPLASLLIQPPESGNSAPSVDHDTGHYVLALSALTRDGYTRNETKSVHPTSKMREKQLAAGDLLISRSNTRELVGFVGIFDEERDDVSFPDTMMRLTVDESSVDKHFLERAMLSQSIRRQIQRVAAGTSDSMKKINRRTLSEIRVPLPPPQSQQQINDIMQSCKRLIGSASLHTSNGLALRKNLANHLLLNAARD